MLPTSASKTGFSHSGQLFLAQLDIIISFLKATSQDQTRFALFYQRESVLKTKKGINFLGQTSASERMPKRSSEA